MDGKKSHFFGGVGKMTALHRFLCTALFGLISGCATIAYDASDEQQLASLTKEVNQQLAAWEVTALLGKPITFDSEYFSTVETDLAVLQVRMEAQFEGEQAVTNAFEVMHKMLADERSLLLKGSGQSTFYYKAERGLWNTQFTVLERFSMIVKPRGSSSEASASTSLTLQ